MRNLKLHTSSGSIGISGAASGCGGFLSGPTRCYVQCAVGSVQRRTKAVQVYLLLCFVLFCSVL